MEGGGGDYFGDVKLSISCFHQSKKKKNDFSIEQAEENKYIQIKAL